MKPTQHLPPVRRFIAIRVMPAFVVLIGIGAIAIGIEQTRLSRASTGWPSVDGEVVQSSIDEERTSTGSGPGARSVTYRPVVVYRYAVQGTTYEARRLSFGEYATADVEDARQVVSRYPLGTRVRVFHAPEQPSTAVLETGGGGLPWLYAAIGAPFVLAGIALAWAAPKLIAPAAASDR